jgi:hypothetical protein
LCVCLERAARGGRKVYLRNTHAIRMQYASNTQPIRNQYASNTHPIKYTSHGLVWVLTPYNTFQHPSLCLPPGGYVGPPGLHIRDHGTF